MNTRLPPLEPSDDDDPGSLPVDPSASSDTPPPDVSEAGGPPRTASAERSMDPRRSVGRSRPGPARAGAVPSGDEGVDPPGGAAGRTPAGQPPAERSSPSGMAGSGDPSLARGRGRRGLGAATAARGDLGSPRQRHANRPTIDLSDLWAPVKPERAHEDRAFLPGALQILEAPASGVRVWAIYALCGLIAVGIIWACIGHLDIYADATGVVQASGKTKVVQPIEPGRVIGIYAGDGRMVRAGDILVKLDPTTAIAQQNVVRDQLFDSRADTLRLKAEVRALDAAIVDVAPRVIWPADIPSSVVEREQQLMQSDLSSLATSLASLQAQKSVAESERDKFNSNIVPQSKVIDLIQEHLGMDNTMLGEGWNSRLTVLTEEQELESARLQLVNLQGSLAQADAQIKVIASQIALTRQDFITKNDSLLLKCQEQVEELEQKLVEADESVSHMTIVASVSGTIEATAVTTVGQAVLAGQQLMQIVPEGAPLEITAYVLNTDAGFVEVGQPVTIKIDTFDYTRYGTISGHITNVAADAMPGKEALTQQKDASTATSATSALSATNAAQQTSDLVFPVTIKPDTPGLYQNGTLLPLTSGMTVTVEIRTESRQAIKFILSPLQSMFQ